MLTAPKPLPLLQSYVIRARLPQCQAPTNVLPFLPLCHRLDTVQDIVRSNTQASRGTYCKGCQRQERQETERGLR